MTHDEQFLSATAGLMRNAPISFTRVNAMRLMAIAGMTDGTTYQALRASSLNTVKLSRTTVRILIEAARAEISDKPVDAAGDFNVAYQEVSFSER